MHVTFNPINLIVLPFLFIDQIPGLGKENNNSQPVGTGLIKACGKYSVSSPYILTFPIGYVQLHTQFPRFLFQVLSIHNKNQTSKGNDLFHCKMINRSLLQLL